MSEAFEHMSALDLFMKRPRRVDATALIAVAGMLLGLLFPGRALADAIRATEEVLEEHLLDVGIEVFDPGVPEPDEVRRKKMQGVFPDIRKSEARYLPVQLKRTLQATGYWGAVRVVPPGTSSAEVTVTGEIRESTGKDLVLAIRVIDASGRNWLEKRYKQKADYRSYSATENLDNRDPFDELYDQIANDVLAVRQKLDPEELEDLRDLTELRFASELSPEAFRDHLAADRKGRLKLKRLPARDDPMLERVGEIRERDHMFVDTLNEHYAGFCAEMEEPYDNWRSFSYEEQLALEELRRQARMRKLIGALAIFGSVVSSGGSSVERAARDAAMIGGIAAIQSGIAKGKQAKMHVEALRELGASFESEVAPMIVEIEGETVRLTGSREDQYTAWRRLLRQIYAAETGLTLDPNTAADLALEEPADQ